MRSGRAAFVTVVLTGSVVVVVAASCAAAPSSPPASTPAPVTVRPGAPGEASRRVESDDITARAAAPVVAADVRFMQHMITHHAQALLMTDLVPARTQNEEIRLLARRIAVSQQDEIAFMRRWLESHADDVTGEPPGHGHAAAVPGADRARMPGMLSADELARLQSATGAEFDRHFTDYMIRHHEGALVMVAELFATDGAGQEPELFQFASHVDADQRAEIARILRMRVEK